MRFRSTVVEVLAAFARYHAPLPAETAGQTATTEYRRLSEPVQAALTVLCGAPSWKKPMG
jgi:hypothetical protein